MWASGKPRIKALILQLPVEKGGSAVPNLRYFYAAQIWAVMQWWFRDNWESWESDQDAVQLPISEVLFLAKEDRRQWITQDHYLRDYLLKTWDKWQGLLCSSLVPHYFLTGQQKWDRRLERPNGLPWWNIGTDQIEHCRLSGGNGHHVSFINFFRLNMSRMVLFLDIVWRILLYSCLFVLI